MFRGFIVKCVKPKWRMFQPEMAQLDQVGHLVPCFEAHLHDETWVCCIGLHMSGLC